MKLKKITRLIGFLIGLVLVLILVLFLCMDSLAKSVIEKLGPEITGVKIELDSLRISPIQGRVSIRNLTVYNPDGYNSENALRMGYVDAEVDLWTLFEPKLHVRELVLKDINVNYETLLLSSNLQDILKNIDSLSAKAKTEKPKGEKEPQTLRIDRLELDNVGMHLVVKGIQSKGVGVAISIPPMGPLGEDAGITPYDLAFRILGAILMNASQQGTIQLSGSLNDLINQTLHFTTDLGVSTRKKVMEGVGTISDAIFGDSSKEKK